MLEQVSLNFKIIASLLLSFGFTYFIIPSVINIATEKNLYAAQDERRSHKGEIPNLGGMAIFISFIISYCIFGDFKIASIKYLLAALSFIFMIGAKDDIIPLPAHKKFIGQFIAAGIIVILGNIRITSFYGVLGITTIPYIVSIVFTIVTIVFIINAFNLIDGINILASSIGLVVSSAFGLWFYIHGYTDYAIMNACLFGALVAFMRYNYASKIFMGDTGSLFIGLLLAIQAIAFIEESADIAFSSVKQPFHVISGPALAIAILIIPIFDTLRVFTVRILNGKSPFSPDKTHHHHILVNNLNLTHIKASLVLVSVNILFIFFTYQLQDLRSAILIPLIFLVAAILSFILYRIKPIKKENPFVQNKQSDSKKTMGIKKL